MNWLIVGTESWPGSVDYTNSTEVELDEKIMQGLRSTYKWRYNIQKAQRVKVTSGTYNVRSDEFNCDTLAMTNKVKRFYKVKSTLTLTARHLHA